MVLRVLYFGTYDRNYPRNRIMIEGLRSAGVQVTECHATIWRNTEEKVAAATSIRSWFRLGSKAAQSYARLVRACLRLPCSYDVMVLGYTGQFDVFLARLLTWFRGKPLVLDVFISLYLSATERKLPMRNLLRLVENVAYRLPDMLIIHTAEYAEWFEHAYGIPGCCFRLVPLGANSHLFKPMPRLQSDGVFRVVFHGSFTPLHGVEYIVRAAALLRNERDICFELIGRGPTRAAAQALAADFGLDQVLFLGWVDEQTLLSRLSAADVVLGVFGATEVSKRTIQVKVYEGLAMARPVITADSPTVRGVFTHAQHIYLVERANAAALASAILTLRSNPDLRARLGEAGYRVFAERFTVEAIGKEARRHLEELLESGSK